MTHEAGRENSMPNKSKLFTPPAAVTSLPRSAWEVREIQMPTRHSKCLGDVSIRRFHGHSWSPWAVVNMMGIWKPHTKFENQIGSSYNDSYVNTQWLGSCTEVLMVIGSKTLQRISFLWSQIKCLQFSWCLSTYRAAEWAVWRFQSCCQLQAVGREANFQQGGPFVPGLSSARHQSPVCKSSFCVWDRT